MTPIPLTNNRLILNGHRIFNKKQFFAYLSKKFKSKITNEQEVSKILNAHKDLKIAIWHGDAFLQEENKKIQDSVIALLKSCGEVKITGHPLKS